VHSINRRPERDFVLVDAGFNDLMRPAMYGSYHQISVHAPDGSRPQGAAETRIAVAGPLLYLPIDEWRQQLEVNLTGVVTVTQAFAPLLGAGGAQPAKDPGRIVNISSVGGRNANPFMAPYCTSKFGLEGLSESLRRELLPFGVDVVVVAPGAVATPIWDKADETDTARYANTVYAPALERLRSYMLSIGKSGLPPETIGEAIHTALTAARPKVRYVVSPSPMQVLMTEILPKRTLDRITGKRLGLI